MLALAEHTSHAQYIYKLNTVDGEGRDFLLYLLEHSCLISNNLRVQHKPFLPKPTSIFKHKLQYAGFEKCLSLHTWHPSSFNELSTPIKVKRKECDDYLHSCCFINRIFCSFPLIFSFLALHLPTLHK